MSGLIIQANLHHSKFATDCLVHDMMLAKCQVIALIQEPYLGGGTTLWASRNSLATTTKGKGVGVGQPSSPRVAIYFFARSTKGGT